jgi:hypothetical protein
MGSLVYLELLDNPRYRRFLDRALPWCDDIEMRHGFITPLVWAARHDSYGFVDLPVSYGSPWKDNVLTRPLMTRNVDRLMLKLKQFILHLFEFSKPEMKHIDAEWGDAYIERGQFVGDLVVLPWILHCEPDFEQLVHVRLRHSDAISVRLQLTFEKHETGRVTEVRAIKF